MNNTVKSFAITIVCFSLTACYKSSEVERVQKVGITKSHPTKYEIAATLKPSKYLTEMKVILEDNKLRDIRSYDGLGEFICNKHTRQNARKNFQCNLSFTNKQGSNNFEIPRILTDHTDYYNNIAAVYNGNSKETMYSCHYVKGITENKCIMDMGRDLLIVSGELKPFNFDSIDVISRGKLIDLSYTGNINLLKHAALKDKMTDNIEIPEMYSMMIGTNFSDIKATCVVGTPPIIRFNKALSDKYEMPQQLLYRVDKADAVVLKQSIGSYLVTKDDIEDNEIILSPEETTEFINEIKNGNKLTIGRQAQREIPLRDLTRLWIKLESFCK